jgi:hypothetical protein
MKSRRQNCRTFVAVPLLRSPVALLAVAALTGSDQIAHHGQTSARPWFDMIDLRGRTMAVAANPMVSVQDSFSHRKTRRSVSCEGSLIENVKQPLIGSIGFHWPKSIRPKGRLRAVALPGVASPIAQPSTTS